MVQAIRAHRLQKITFVCELMWLGGEKERKQRKEHAVSAKFRINA